MSVEPKPGETWRHYKGGIYTVVTLARDEADPSRLLVVYRSKDGQTGEGETWVRPLADWLRPASVGGVGLVPRFIRVL